MCCHLMNSCQNDDPPRHLSKPYPNPPCAAWQAERLARQARAAAEKHRAALGRAQQAFEEAKRAHAEAKKQIGIKSPTKGRESDVHSEWRRPGVGFGGCMVT